MAGKLPWSASTPAALANQIGQPASVLPNFLAHAWSAIDRAASDAAIAVILGTERVDGDRLLITTRVQCV